MSDFKLIERPVSRRKNRNNKYIYKEKSAQDYITIIENIKTTIKNSLYYEALQKALDHIPSESIKYIRCLALGSPTGTTGVHCQYQLALLFILLQHFHLDTSNVSIWDPVFEPKDLELFKLYNIDVSEEDPDEDIPVSNWLFYMPHAPHNLTEKILKQVDDSSTGFILGNDLLTFDTRVIENEESTTDIAFIRNISKQLQTDESCWKIQQIPNLPLKNANWLTAFYDMSLHIKTIISARSSSGL